MATGGGLTPRAKKLLKKKPSKKRQIAAAIMVKSRKHPSPKGVSLAKKLQRSATRQYRGRRR